MTLPLETGQIRDDWARRAIEQIALHFPLHALDLANDVLLLAVTGTARKIAFGSTTATFTAATNTPAVTITHGLGTTPIACGPIGTTGIAAVRGDIFTSVVAGSVGATTFQVQSFVGNQAVNTTGTVTIYWAAIG